MFFKDPCIDTANAMESMKQKNAVRNGIFSSAILKEQVKKMVGTDLSYHRNYVKKKLFNVEWAGVHVDEFAKHLFGSRAAFDGAMKKSAASLRYLRDREFRGWDLIMEKEDKIAFENNLKQFYEKYSNFRTEIIVHKSFSSLADYYEAVLESDLNHYNVNQTEEDIIE